MAETKQILILRKDLGMNKGKMIAQGSHGSLGTILNLMRGGVSHEDFKPEIKDGKYTLSLEVEVGSPLDKWIRGDFTKVCLYAVSEEELISLYEQAKEKGLNAVLIEDNGLTCFNGIKTKTCVAIGPDLSVKIDEITGHLKIIL